MHHQLHFHLPVSNLYEVTRNLSLILVTAVLVVSVSYVVLYALMTFDNSEHVAIKTLYELLNVGLKDDDDTL